MERGCRSSMAGFSPRWRKILHGFSWHQNTENEEMNMSNSASRWYDLIRQLIVSELLDEIAHVTILSAIKALHYTEIILFS